VASLPLSGGHLTLRLGVPQPAVTIILSNLVE